VAYDFAFPTRNAAQLSAYAEAALAFLPRDRLVDWVEARDNLTLYALAHPPPVLASR
jgi:hypothetical protein